MALDYSMLGAGLGTLPSLIQLLTGKTPMANAQNTAANSGNFQGSGLNAGQVAAVSPDPAQATAAYNFANSGGQSTTQPQWKWGGQTMTPANAGTTPAANPAPTAANGTNPLAALAAAFGGGGTNGTGTGVAGLTGLANMGAATSLPNGGTQLAAPKLAAPVGGGGPTPTSIAGALSPATAMATPQLASGLAGAPLGPAAQNPMLLALLRQKLGMGGGLSGSGLAG